jgi:hypothetical protein
MKKVWWLTALVVLVLTIGPASVLAAQYNPEADAFINSGAPDTPSNTGTNLSNLWGESSLATCNPSRASLIRWDFSTISGVVALDSAKISLKVNFASGTTGQTGARLSLERSHHLEHSCGGV